MLSVVLPAYNEEKMIQKAADTIDRILSAEKIPYEIVFVNDGSKDHTWEEIERAAGRNPNVTGVNFSRNFGKESAMYAGLASASGDWTVPCSIRRRHWWRCTVCGSRGMR